MNNKKSFRSKILFRDELLFFYKSIKTIFANKRIRKALENRTNMEDDRVAILEAQLSQAKLIAEEADKKYEEVEQHF